ncbi:MAG: hypothetical protein ACRELG_15115, partial [Gemmataceae bacterium]
VEFYRRTVAAAWLLSQESDEITLESVRRANDHPSAIAAAWDQYEREKLGIEVIPEVAAEVVGFARSTRRREGLYALVDVGAGTVDVCTFRLHAPTPGMDRYSMFIADVQPQGAAVLREWSASGNPIAEFRKQVDRTIRGCIWNTKRLRDSTAREWRKGLPVFLCGGGRASDFYKGAAKDIGPWLFMHTGARQLPTLALDVPEEFDAQTERSNFHRLAVAWGLSYQKFDIGELQAPNEIENMPAGRVRDFIGSYVSKDQM